MGSKNLKAVAVKGTGAIAVARPDYLLKLTKLIVEEEKILILLYQHLMKSKQKRY
jgi:aldehyde:ferredoxin oxidoreductase